MSKNSQSKSSSLQFLALFSHFPGVGLYLWGHKALLLPILPAFRVR